MLALPIMYVLARRKIAVAEALGSGAMRADAMEAVTCSWLSLVVVARGMEQRVLLRLNAPFSHST